MSMKSNKLDEDTVSAACGRLIALVGISILIFFVVNAACSFFNWTMEEAVFYVVCYLWAKTIVYRVR